MAKPALGRGLGALMGGSPAGNKPAVPAPAQTTPPPSSQPASTPPAPAPVATGEQVRKLVIAQVRPCSFQPRKDFGEEALKELADSIREQGVLQPIVVRPRNGAFELIAGERRWRAAQLAGLTEIPALVREADDRKVLELALIENLQRENLNPVEEALGYQRLMDEFKLTQEEASVRVGKSRVTVANLIRLLQLAPEVQAYLRSNLLTFGHARAILGMPNHADQKVIAEQVIREGLSVRETEALVAERRDGKSTATSTVSGSKASSQPDVHVASLQSRLQERFGTKVALKYKKGKGAVEIRFFNDDDLDRILEIVGIKPD